MATEIGSKGLAEVNLVIPQGTSLGFTVTHTDEQGEPVDHTGSTCHMAFQKKGSDTIDVSQCCAPMDGAISVNITSDVTSGLSLGKMSWDLIVETESGDVTRLAYGSVSIVDTYALDGE